MKCSSVFNIKLIELFYVLGTLNICMQIVTYGRDKCFIIYSCNTCAFPGNCRVIVVLIFLFYDET